MTFGWTTIRENDVRLNNDSKKCRSELWSFADSTIRLVTIRSNDFGHFFFGTTTIRPNCISAKRRLDGMTFRENDLASDAINLQRFFWWKLDKFVPVYMYFTMVAYLSMPTMPMVLNFIMPLNESRPKVLPSHAEYFIEEPTEHYVPLFLHQSLGTFSSVTTVIICDTMYVTYVQHACGIFAVVKYETFYNNYYFFSNFIL